MNAMNTAVKSHIPFGLGLVLALVAGAPGTASAQGSNDDGDWWEWALASDGGASAAGSASSAPVFLDNAAAPMTLRGNRRAVHRRQWRRAHWPDVRFRPHEGSGRLDGRLGRRELEAILGARVLGRLMEYGDPIGARNFLNGRWKRVDRDGARVLQLRSADRPLAELSDVDGDGRVDAVLLHDLE